jgi:hypothetical protein
MRYRMLNPKIHFLQNVVFGGVVFVLLGTLWAADSNTAPLATEPMPAPDANIVWTVAFSSPSGRTAVSAGRGIHKPTNLYINSPAAPENFQIYWSPNTEVHNVDSLTWSHNENMLAFIGTSGSRTTETIETCLYILDTTSSEFRNILKISEVVDGEEQQLVNVDKGKSKTVLAWLGNNKVCMPTRDNSIIAVDCNDGHIETLVPAQDCKIWGPVSVSPDKLRFLKIRPSGQGQEVEVCDFDGSQVVSLGIIPSAVDKTSPFVWLSADGKYAFVGVEEDFEWPSGKHSSFLEKIVIWELSQMTSVKEILVRAESNIEEYLYIPVTVLKGEQLVLIKHIDNKDSTQLMSQSRLCAVSL